MSEETAPYSHVGVTDGHRPTVPIDGFVEDGLVPTDRYGDVPDGWASNPRSGNLFQNISPSDPYNNGDAVQAIAEVISLSYGENPDDDAPLSRICGPNNEPLPCWMVYDEQAKAVLAWIFPVFDALEQIAREQNVYKGHGDFDTVPYLSSEQAQTVARSALAMVHHKTNVVPNVDIASVRMMIDKFSLWEKRDADHYNVSADHLSREILSLVAPSPQTKMWGEGA